MCVWGGGLHGKETAPSRLQSLPRKRNPLELKDVNKAISLENAKGM